MALTFTAGCGTGTGGSETPAWTGGTVPTWMLGTWYSGYNLTRTTITQNSPAQYEYSYDGTNEFKGGIDVDETAGTIHYAETYMWDNGQWVFDDDPLHERAWYVYSGNYLFTEAFYQDMQVWVRTAGTSGSLQGTWQYQYQTWYGTEDASSYIANRRWILTLNGDGTYNRKKYNNDELLEETNGNWTYSDINPEELYLSATADIGMAWVVENDYLVMAPRYETQAEIAMIKE
jgi:hypothetical protein